MFPLFGPPLPLVLQNLGSTGFPILSSVGSYLFLMSFLIFFLLGTDLFPMLLTVSFPDLQKFRLVLFPAPFLHGAHSLWVFGPVPGGFGRVLRSSSGYFGEVVVGVIAPSLWVFGRVLRSSSSGSFGEVVIIVVVVFLVGRWGSTAAIAAAEGLFFLRHRGDGGGAGGGVRGRLNW